LSSRTNASEKKVAVEKNASLNSETSHLSALAIVLTGRDEAGSKVARTK